MGTIISSYEFRISKEFHDDIGLYSPKRSSDFLKRYITKGSHHQVLTLIEFILRHKCCSEKLREDLVNAFDEVPISYFVDNKDGHPTIMPRPSREAGEATQQAIETLRKRNMSGATTHLRQAAEHINAQQYADSVIDSMSAVESVARRIDPKSNTLGKVLNALEKKKIIDKLLKTGIEGIYAYANSEGFRIALVFKDSPNVSLDEAMFMYGACASFSAYLAKKHRQVKEREANTE